MLLQNSLNLVLTGEALDYSLGSGERKLSFALQQLDCTECKMHQCTVLMKHKPVINSVFNNI